jgi:cell fate regulator YaaT (PSP1 superfamily)
MACGNCGTTEDGLPKGCKNNGACGVGGCNHKLSVFDWLANMELPQGTKKFNIIEVRFKNGRKDFYKIDDDTEYYAGDIIAVEAASGHDIGVVSMTGELVKLQMKKRNISVTSPDIKKAYRKAKPLDVEKWQAAQQLEKETMYRARVIALKYKLRMKISDVEYQGDKTKATFYYTAEERVDFRELIKGLHEEFKVKIEMRQIGSRQEASRLGGIGSCGRELCCSTWLTDFRSVSTSAARYQQLSLNPLKLAGQCGKLKCCLNYELDTYLDELKDFPDTAENIKTKKGWAFHQKTDIFKRMMWYSYTDEPGVFIPLEVDKVKELYEQNKKGVVPEDLKNYSYVVEIAAVEHDYENVVGQDSLTRFDKKKKPNNRNKPRPKGPRIEGSALPANNAAPTSNPKPRQENRPQGELKAGTEQRPNNPQTKANNPNQVRNNNRPQGASNPYQNRNNNNRSNTGGAPKTQPAKPNTDNESKSE